MISVNKINLTDIKHENELGNSRLDFKLSGPNINYVIANTIRRTIFSDIPIYAFNEFTFEKNSSVFNNTYLKLRLRQLPIWGIENTIEFIDYNIKPTESILDDIQDQDEDIDNIELNIEKTLNVSNLKQFTMYVNAKNKTTNIMTVTTNNAKFYYDEKQIESPYKSHIPIVKLQPGQEILFSAITKIGCEHEDAMYGAACIAGYKQINENEFDFYVESRGQIDEKRIMYVAMINIERKIRNFLKLLDEDKKNKINSDEEDKLQGLIIVNNEDHTLGNLISRGLQLHPSVSFAGYNLPHPLSKKVHFHYKLEKAGNIRKILKEVVDYYSKIFSHIKKQFNVDKVNK
jgi:DNA-directed RNA polymerase subunit L